MSLRRQLSVSFLVQGVGAASVLLATLWVGAALGPEVQGMFSRAKSEIEFVAAFAMFGLPQALFFHLKAGRIDPGSALRWAAGSTLLALPVAGAYTALQHPQADGALWALLALAVAAAVCHGQLRGLVLVSDATAWFNVVTAAPQLLALAGAAIAIGGVAQPGPATWLTVFAVASGATAVLAGWRLARRGSVRSSQTRRAGWRSLARYGLGAWLTAALSTAAILAMQRVVEAAEGRAALGQFTMAMTLTQVPLTPISYAAPLLFRRWMEQPGARASRRWAGRFFLTVLGAAALVALASWRWSDLGLGPGYVGTAEALAVLLLGGAAEAASRVLAVQANATGEPWLAVRAETARWLVLLTGWLAMARFAGAAKGLMPFCALWSLAAVAAAACFLLRRTPAPAAPLARREGP